LGIQSFDPGKQDENPNIMQFSPNFFVSSANFSSSIHSIIERLNFQKISSLQRTLSDFRKEFFSKDSKFSTI